MSRKGRFKVKWSTAPEKFREKVSAMKDWIQHNRTLPLAAIWKTVNAKLAGHYASSSVSDNWPKLLAFRTATMWILYTWLNRRGQRKSFDPSTWIACVDLMGLASPMRVVANVNAVGP
jgi:RNA-directed DNA polymerase